MAFPTVQATATSFTTPGSTSHTVTLPAGIVSGDRLLVLFGVDNVPTLTWPADWILVERRVNGTTLAQEIRYRDADGTEGSSITVTSSGGGVESGHNAYRITGHAATAPESATAIGTSTSADPPLLNPAGWDVEDTLWIAAGGARDFILSGTPTNYTDVLDTGGTATPGMRSARRNLAAASEDPGAYTVADEGEWIAATVAMRPAADGPAAGGWWGGLLTMGAGS